MALINYLTRIHFADSVLEEALRSEMERMGKRRPLIVAKHKHIEGGIAEGLYASFPIRTKITTFCEIPATVTEQAADQLAQLYRAENCDLMVAFGGNETIDLAKVARMALLHDKPAGLLDREEGGKPAAGDRTVDLIAIPDISGFSSAVSDYSRIRLDDGAQAIVRARQMIPTVVICDPTITLGTSAPSGASAAASVIARGVGTYFASGFNPPADGLVLDSLSRVVDNAEAALKHDDLGARREMMAGSLNSALSMQKGLCAVHAITNALAAVTKSPLDFGATSRLILPALVQFYSGVPCTRFDALKRSLRIRDEIDLAQGLTSLLGPLPLPNTLSRMGVKSGHLKEAALRASQDRAIRNGPRRLGKADVAHILQSVH